MAVLYESPPKEGMFGLAVEINGKVEGIAALIVYHGQRVAVSAITNTLRCYPLTIMKAANKFRPILNKHGQGAYAIASDDECNSDAFLERVGFSFSGYSVNGRVYRWFK